MPEASSSSSVKNVIDSLPSARLRQNSSIFLAPGKRPARPMMAIPSGRSRASVSLIRLFSETNSEPLHQLLAFFARVPLFLGHRLHVFERGSSFLFLAEVLCQGADG